MHCLGILSHVVKIWVSDKNVDLFKKWDSYLAQLLVANIMFQVARYGVH